jgi:hypothetical protein
MNEISQLQRDEIIKKFNRLQTRYNNLSQTNNVLQRDNDRLNTERDIQTIEKVKRLEEEKHELEKRLHGFTILKNVGNVYSLTPLTGYKTFRELFFSACNDIGYTEEKIDEVLDFTLKDNPDGSQYRSLSSKLCYSKYLTLSKKLARQYAKQFEKSSPRYKAKKTTKDMVKGKSGFHNQYPENYKDIIEDYVLNNPLEVWGELPSPIVYIDGVFSCELCEKDIKYSSIRSHLNSKKHKKKIE